MILLETCIFTVRYNKPLIFLELHPLDLMLAEPRHCDVLELYLCPGKAKSHIVQSQGIQGSQPGLGHSLLHVLFQGEDDSGETQR